MRLCAKRAAFCATVLAVPGKDHGCEFYFIFDGQQSAAPPGRPEKKKKKKNLVVAKLFRGYEKPDEKKA